MKRFLSAIIATVLVLTSAFVLLPLSVSAETGEADWNGTASTAFSEGAGTVVNPYIIKTGADLAYFGQLVNGATACTSHFKLANDIYYNDIRNNAAASWTSTIAPAYNYASNGTDSKRFSGTLDGAGYTIYGLYNFSASSAYHGLVNVLGCVKDDGEGQTAKSAASDVATIKNLTISDSYFGGATSTNNKCGIGAFAGNAAEWATVQNCQTTASVKVNGESRATGGIVGFTGNGAVYVTIEDCVNRAAVYVNSGTDGGVAGILGKTATRVDNTVFITRCVNYGKIDANGYGGGIIPMGGTLSYCVNYGEVSGLNRVGGIMGMLSFTDYSNSFMDNCINYGSVTGTTTNVGGLVGVVGSKGSTASSQLLKNCVNYGKVKGENGIAVATFNEDVTVTIDQVYSTVANSEKNIKALGDDSLRLTMSIQSVVDKPVLSAYQIADNGDGTKDVRFASVIGALEHKAAGYEITTSPASANSPYDVECEKVYTGLTAIGGKALTATECGGNYFIALTIENIPVTAGTVTFTVKPFVTDAAGVRSYGATETVVINMATAQ